MWSRKYAAAILRYISRRANTHDALSIIYCDVTRWAIIEQLPVINVILGI